jgi:putative ABC transport system permease protein
LWRTAARIAWRDLSGWPGRSLFIALSIALSVASISGVRGAASVARRTLEGDSRAWLAGDVGVDTLEPLDVNQAQALDGAKTRGIRWTVVTMASTMASSDQAADPEFISVKAVDPDAYPFYGEIVLNPRQPLRAALHENTAAVSQEVLERLQVNLGDTILIAGKPFQIAARIDSDPARFSNDLGLGMRCILSRRGFSRTALAQSENSIRNRILLKLPDEMPVESGRQMLEDLFPGASLRDYRAGYRQQTEIALTFLSVTAFLALGLGALGVGISVREQAEQRLPSFAVMKMLGSRTQQTALVFLLEIAIIAAAGFATGVPLGLFVEGSILKLAGKYLVLPPTSLAEIWPLIGTAAAALLAMTPVLVQPLLLIGMLRPAVILRRDVERQPLSFEKIRSQAAWITGAISFLILAALGYGLLQSPVAALGLAAAVAIGIGLAASLTTGALALLRRSASAEPARRTPVLRLAIASLCGPGNRSRMLIAALSTALALMMTTFEASGAVVRAIFEMLPYDRNGLYIARFKDAHAAELRAFLEQQPGVQNVQIVTQARLDLKQVDRQQPTDLPSLVVCDDALRESAIVLSEDTARQFHAHIGSTLLFDARDDHISARVIAIRPLTDEERVWSNMKLDCSAVDRRILFHQAVVRIAPDRIAAVRKAVAVEYPTFAVITPDDISITVKEVSQDAMSLARLVTWFAAGAGLCVLAAIVAASRSQRLKEIGILTTLGARRSTLYKLFTLEFAVIGALSAAIASLLTCGLNAVVLSVVFHRLETAIAWMPIAAAAFIAILVIVLAGWAPTFRLLARKPMDILRGE